MPAANQPPKIGMIVLKTDETVEDESRFYLRGSNVGLLTTRIPVSDTITPETLQAMRGHMQQALSLFPDDSEFDVVAYVCTSAATVIGEENVAALLHRFVRTRLVTNPLSAAKAALAHLGARRIAYLSPYISEVACAMQEAFSTAGLQIITSSSFGISSDRAVAALPPQKIMQALLSFADSDIDAVFVSCTNLKCADILPSAEQQLGKPVISSNQALLWHTLQLAQAPIPNNQLFGRLFEAGE